MKYKKGDRILFKKGLFAGQIVHAWILAIKKDWLGNVYYIKWWVDSDCSGRYETTGIIRDRSILGKG